MTTTSNGIPLNRNRLASIVEPVSIAAGTKVLRVEHIDGDFVDRSRPVALLKPIMINRVQFSVDASGFPIGRCPL